MAIISDIYVGKPDARDELIFDGYDNFIKSFVAPPGFDFNGLLVGDKCFIRGYKGTGKTALLIYLQDYLLKKDISTYTSFLLFKDQYKAMQRKELTAISSRIVRAIDTSEAVSSDHDFEDIWRWIFLKQIVEDNELCNHGLFKDNDSWHLFSKAVKNILSDEKDSKVFIIPKKIRLGFDYAVDTIGKQSVSPNVEVNFEDRENLKEYSLFVKQVNMAIELLEKLERTDIPYFTFVDELEAFFSDEDLMKRDLQLIRDLIITVKFFNQLFAAYGQSETKIVASVRTEIINSISRFIPGKEINKIIVGFECSLLWDYNNTNSYAHPIIQIWLKRIALTLQDTESPLSENLYKTWFPEKIDGIEPANYILNNSWSKPRDIVRFLSSAKNCLQASQGAYTGAVFDALMKEYSIESRKEIVEEMNSLYSSKEIDVIFSCLRGYKSTFSFMELQERVKLYFPGSFLESNLLGIVRDLYRLGVLGNYSRYSKQFRWQHKGDEDVLLVDDWMLFVHRALQKDLSINARRDRSIRFLEVRQNFENEISVCIGAKVDFTVKRILPFLAIGTFLYNGVEIDGTIHISQIANEYVGNIRDYLSIGKTIQAIVIEKSPNHRASWRLSKKKMDDLLNS